MDKLDSLIRIFTLNLELCSRYETTVYKLYWDCVNSTIDFDCAKKIANELKAKVLSQEERIARIYHKYQKEVDELEEQEKVYYMNPDFTTWYNRINRGEL